MESKEGERKRQREMTEERSKEGERKRQREMTEENVQLKEIQMLEGHTGKVWTVAWNPVAGTDGTPAILASCGADRTVRIWKQNPDSADSAFDCVKIIKGDRTGTGRSCSWSPCGDFLAITSYDGTTSIWKKIEDDFQHKQILKPEGDKEEVVNVSWHPSRHLQQSFCPDLGTTGF